MPDMRQTTMPRKVRLAEKFTLFTTHWSPHVVGEVNGQLIKIARGEGELVWHKHDNEDEMFLVLEGQLTLKLETGDQVLEPGELMVVPKGVMHCPVAIPGTRFMMIEPASTAQLGDYEGEINPAADQPWI